MAKRKLSQLLKTPAREEKRKVEERDKARKKLVKDLKHEIDYAALYIYLADIGAIEIKDVFSETTKSREKIISILTEKKQKISDNIDILMAEIDDAINKMS